MVLKLVCFYILLLKCVIAYKINTIPVFSEKGTRYLESIGELNKTENINNKIEKRDKSMQINYYWDGGCKNYAAQVDWQSNWYGCYNYYIPGTWSNSIATCRSANGCLCTFYSNSDCTGGGTEWNAYRNGNNVNCNNNGGLGVRSLRCASR
jgi:hypothetical protein